MYHPPHHREEDHQRMREFIKNHPFAFLSGCDEKNKPIATQIPLFIENADGREVLRGHVMKGTDHHLAFLQNPQVLAVFTGEHTYVSGSWYSNPHTPSTWNYMSVHVAGTIKFLPKPELEEILRMTTLYFEDQNPDSPTVYDNLPEKKRQMMLGMIEGFEIGIEEIKAVFKLSQDRDKQSYRNIIRKLREQGGDAGEIAAEMERREGEVFSSSSSNSNSSSNSSSL